MQEVLTWEHGGRVALFTGLIPTDGGRRREIKCRKNKTERSNYSMSIMLS